MDWVRACEAGPAPPGPAVAAQCRRRLYAYRFAVATLIAARDRLLLRHYADALAGGALPPDPAAPYREATRELRALLPALPGTDADPAGWHAWATALSAALDRSTAPDPHPAPAAGPPPAGPEDPYAQLWRRIGGLGRYVGQSLGDAPADGFRALREAATADGGDGARMTGALTAAEILLGPLRPDPLAEATDISFHTVSAATTSWATRTVLGGAPDTSPEELVRAKLSGNQSANFAAFLSARWRLGDWTWGRLDAAASSWPSSPPTSASPRPSAPPPTTRTSARGWPPPCRPAPDSPGSGPRTSACARTCPAGTGSATCSPPCASARSSPRNSR